MKKRMLSILLAVCMVVVMVPAAFAVQVDTPTGLQWVTQEGSIGQGTSQGGTYQHIVYPGDIVWNRVANGSNKYNIEMLLNGEVVDQTTHSFSATDTSPQLIVGMFRDQPRESGEYTFTLQALGDGNEYEDSETVTSGVFQYTRPSEQLATPTNLRWDGSTARWDKVENAVGYDVRWYYSETANGEFTFVGSVTTYWGGASSTSEELSDWVLTDHGAGYYVFEVRAIAGDITETCPSELSARSAVYSTEGATVSVSDSLNSIMSNLGDNPTDEKVKQAVEAVKKLDSDELRVAMAADTTGDGVTEQIAELESNTQVSLSTSVDKSFGINTDDISLTGAKLNANGNQVTFNVTKPSDEIKVNVPAAYKNTVQFDFKLEGAATESDGEFAVPIKITMPVPAGIDPDRLRILHYTAAGNYEEVIFPAITEKNGTYYATFVVKHFSVFVFAEGNTAALIGKTPYTSLQEAINFAQSGDTIDLYCNHPDTTVVKVEGKSLKISGGVYKIDPDVVTVGANCTKTVTGTNGKDQVISVVYSSSGGGTSTGGGSGSSSSSNKPTASVSGAGGKVTVANDGTVTITPDAGYQIAKITVNGKEVDIPTNGKLTGLTKDDKVVVTFEKVPAEEQPGTSATPFADVAAGAWYADAVQYVYEKGMMNGTGETTFSPDETTTRGMIVTMLHRLEKEPAAAAAGFADVDAGSWYADAVAWAAANGVVNGVSDTAFAPETAITREQMAAILYRYAQLKGYDVSVGEDTNILSYTDAGQISEYAIPAMQWACGAGLFEGDTATTLNPLGNATRAEVATILMRFCEDVA